MSKTGSYNYFDLSDLFQQAFGIRPTPQFTIPTKAAGNNNNDLPGFNIDKKAPATTSGTLGSVLYDNDVYGREYFMPVTLGGVKLWFPVISLVLKKSVVETSMVERRGTVKEIINTEDIKISIKGLIVNPYYNFPEAELIQLNDLFCRQQSLTIRSALTDIFFYDKTASIQDTYNVLITDIPLPGIAGVKHVKPYQIECLSDTVFDLEKI